MCDKVNESESLINLVRCNKPKGAGLDPKGKWSGMGAVGTPIVDVVPSGNRWNLSHTGMHTERGKPHVLRAVDNPFIVWKANRKRRLWDRG